MFRGLKVVDNSAMKIWGGLKFVHSWMKSLTGVGRYHNMLHHFHKLLSPKAGFSYDPKFCLKVNADSSWITVTYAWMKSVFSNRRDKFIVSKMSANFHHAKLKRFEYLTFKKCLWLAFTSLALVINLKCWNWQSCTFHGPNFTSAVWYFSREVWMSLYCNALASQLIN